MKNLVFGILTAILAGTDLWCKSYIEEHFKKGEERKVCKGKIVVRRVHNKGMALNFGDKYPELVRLVSGVVCGVTGIWSIYVWLKERCPWKKLGATFTFAGAISNTYDRFVRKYVVDYLGLKNITFNLADMFIFIGSGILLVSELFRKEG